MRHGVTSRRHVGGDVIERSPGGAQRRRPPGVEGAALGLGEAVQHGVGDERMGHLGAVGASGPGEAEVAEQADGVDSGRLGETADVGHLRGSGRSVDDGERGQRHAGRLGQRIESVAEQLPHVARDLEGVGAGVPDGAAAAGGASRVEVAGEGVGDERHPAGPPDDLLGEPRRQRPAERGAGHGRDLRVAEGSEREVGGTGSAAEVGQQAANVGSVPDVARPVGQGQSDGHRRQLVGEVAEELDGGDVGPVQVVDDDEDRPGATQPGHEEGDGLEQPGPGHLGIAGGAVVLRGDAQPADDPGEVGQAVDEGGPLVLGERVEVAGECPADRGEGDAAAEDGAAAGEDGDATVDGPLPQRREKGGLAEPGFTCEEHHDRVPAVEGVDGRVERRQLTLSPDDRVAHRRR